MVKGTRRIRHYHGAMIHGLHKSLFIGCHHIVLHEPIILFIIKIADWLIRIELEIKVCVIDREYFPNNI
ncbi:hypothetical protein [Candidatus Harpocratesius sp.]